MLQNPNLEFCGPSPWIVLPSCHTLCFLIHPLHNLARSTLHAQYLSAQYFSVLCMHQLLLIKGNMWFWFFVVKICDSKEFACVESLSWASFFALPLLFCFHKCDSTYLPYSNKYMSTCLNNIMKQGSNIYLENISSNKVRYFFIFLDKKQLFKCLCCLASKCIFTIVITHVQITFLHYILYMKVRILALIIIGIILLI